MKATCSRPEEEGTLGPVPGMTQKAMRWCSWSKQRNEMREDSKRASAPRTALYHATISAKLDVRRKMCASIAGRRTGV